MRQACALSSSERAGGHVRGIIGFLVSIPKGVKRKWTCAGPRACPVRGRLVASAAGDQDLGQVGDPRGLHRYRRKLELKLSSRDLYLEHGKKTHMNMEALP